MREEKADSPRGGKKEEEEEKKHASRWYKKVCI
jgi:cytochrome b subunit of formate dehydrogenase